MPDEVTEQVEGQVSEPQVAEAAAPVSQPEPQQQVTSQPTPQAEQYTGLIEYAKSNGYELPWQDDRQAFNGLLAAYQQLPYAQRYQQYGGQFEQWLQEREQQRQAEEAKKGEWWKAPEYNPGWRSQIKRLPDGSLAPAEGATPDVVQKYLNYQNWLAETQQKFFHNPVETIKPGIEQIVQPLIQQAIQQYSAQLQSQSILNRHSEWMLARTPDGGIAYGHNGIPHLTPHGAAFSRYMTDLESTGVSDPLVRERLALRLVHGDMMAGQARPQQAAAQQQNQNQRFLQQNNRRQPNARPQEAVGVATNGSLTENELAQQMMTDLRSAGFTSENFH